MWRFFACLTQFKSIGWDKLREVCFIDSEDQNELEQVVFESSTGILQRSPILELTTSGLHWLYELHPKVDTFEILNDVVCRFRSVSSLSPFDGVALATCIALSHCQWELTLSGEMSKDTIKMLI